MRVAAVANVAVIQADRTMRLLHNEKAAPSFTVAFLENVWVLRCHWEVVDVGTPKGMRKWSSRERTNEA